MHKAERKERNALIVKWYRDRGYSLAGIGEGFGLTPEGVRFILKAEKVPLRSRGTVTNPEVKALKLSQLDKSFNRKYGCDYLVQRLVSALHPKLFNYWVHHRNDARRRKHEWTLTYPQYAWLAGIETRTNTAFDRKLVLTRRNVPGPYSFENAYFTTRKNVIYKGRKNAAV